jgi:hypothetical protein
MRRLTKFAMAFAMLGAVAVAGCGQSACGAHPSGLACEQEQSKHKTEEEANRRKEEQNTPQAKEERKSQEEREREPSKKYSGAQVAHMFSEEFQPAGTSPSETSCPEGTYEDSSHLICTVGLKQFEVTVESDGIHSKELEESSAPEADG